MIALADSDVSSGIDFVEFFRLFMFTPCTSIHQALTEWRNKVALDQGKNPSTRSLLGDHNKRTVSDAPNCSTNETPEESEVSERALRQKRRSSVRNCYN